MSNPIEAVALEVTPMDMALLMSGVAKIMELTAQAKEDELPAEVKAYGVMECMRLLDKLNRVVEHAMNTMNDTPNVTDREPMKS
jgi:hypothetical protein